MDALGSVQHKVSCVFETTVLNEQSTKRENQSYRVVASERIKQRAIDNDIHTALVTEKLDGTCVYVAKFEDKPWLWARYDRKPTKGAEKRFKKFQHQKQKQQGSDEGSNKAGQFKWDMDKDFKETPEYWIPASGVEIVAGSPIPDDIGHTPGWLPVSPSSRQQCWHLSAVDLNLGLALVLREVDDIDSDDFCIDCLHMSELEGHTAELIGTNINGNPYGIGSKKFPIHFLVIHGSLGIKTPPEIQMEAIKKWFQNEGQVEGLVWHCANGNLFKLHRNHVALPWPIDSPNLTKHCVSVAVDTTKYELDNDDSLIAQFGKVHGHTCESVKDLKTLFISEENDSTVVSCQKKTGSQINNDGTLS